MMGDMMRFLNACRDRFAFALMAVVLAAAPARAELVVDITSGFVEPLPIAVTDFFGEAVEEAKVGTDIAGTRTPSFRTPIPCARGRASATGA
jgi:hypothetical protein